ncbi:glycosyltransferase family 2 protein [Lentisphaerota bacterium WC36G]|nr:glycosyltransferase family 2 protein [Lentisphaerae bacterium WC36]
MSQKIKDIDDKCVSIVIPLFNEEKTIKVLLEKLVRIIPKSHKEIIVVNDGSTDDSYNSVKDFITNFCSNIDSNSSYFYGENSQENLEFKLFTKENGGKGSAVKLGFKNSTGKAVIVQDADLEYDVNDIEACVTPIISDDSLVVYGSRETGDRERFSHLRFYLGGLAVTAVMNLLFGSELTDEPTCYKAFNGELIRNIQLKGNRFDWEPEITAIILKLGITIEEVPINYFPRSLDEGKKIRWYDGLMAFWVSFLQLFISNRRHYTVIKNNCKNLQIVKTIQLHFTKMIWLMIIFNVAFGVRLFFGFKSFSNLKLLFRPDSLGYLQPAISLARDNLYNESLHSTIAETTRAVGFPFFMSLFFRFFEDNTALIIASIVLMLLSALGVFYVYAAARLFKCSYNWSLFAACLYALSATSVANAPMMLSDTLHTFFTTLLFYFFTRYYIAKNPLYAVIAIFYCGIATLIRPVNLVWIIPAVFLILINNHHVFKIRIMTALSCIIVFAAVITPWMARNYCSGSGFVIDDNYGNMLYHNGAVLLAKIEGRDSGKIRRELIAKTEKHFVDNSDVFANNKRAQYQYKTNELKKLVLTHPVQYIKLHFRPWVLVPDLPGLLELQEVTTSNRGTFDVLNKSGFFAAVKHYLNGNYLLIIWLFPFILVTFFSYFGTLITILKWIFTKKIFWLFYALAFIEYYLILPGPITMPRYIMPALPVFCVFAAIGFSNLKNFLLKKDYS